MNKDGNISEHKLETRECPACHESKTFPARNKYCSNACSGVGRSKAEEPDSSERPQNTREDEVTDREWTIRMVSDRVKDYDQLIAACDVDLSVWRPDRFKCKSYEVTYVPRATRKSGDEKWIRPSTRAITIPMFAISATFVRRIEVNAVKKEIEALKKDALEYFSGITIHVPTIPASQSGNMLETSTPDLHLGKFAWAEETGWHNYDTNTARDIGRTAMATMLSRTQSFGRDRICLILGNDWIHFDNREQTTTKGTPQHGDSRYYKVFETGRRMAEDMVLICRDLCSRVDVVMVPGNHDSLSTWHLGHSLECIFRNVDGVRIDNAPTRRKYLQHGRCMVMWTHGDKGKREKYPLLMATEQPKMFGATRFREAHVGHYHGKEDREHNGVYVRTLRSLCAPDAWHADNGYVANIRSAESIVWNEFEGVIGTAAYSIDDDPGIEAA